MGNKQSRSGMTPSELLELQKKTYLSHDEIYFIYETFRKISSSKEDDGLIDYDEFRTALGLRSGYFSEQFFELFDKSKDKLINFDEFASAIAIMSNKLPKKDKLKYLFRFYDTNGDGSISRDELMKVTQALFFQNYITLTEDQLNSIIEETFRVSDINGDRSIDFKEFYSVCSYQIPLDLSPLLYHP